MFFPRLAVALAAFAALVFCLLPAHAAENPPSPTGFGRFGRLNNDGLLTLNVTPDGFETQGEHPFYVTWHDSKWKADGTVERIDSTEKQVRFTRGMAEPATVIYTLLYPGIELSKARRYLFEFTNASESVVFRPRIEQAGKLRDGSVVLLLRRTDHASPPVVLVAPADSLPVPDPAQPYGLSLRREKPFVVRWLTPWGIQAIPASVPLSQLRQTALFWAGTPIPHRVGYAESVSADGQLVTITEKFSGNIAPLPPVLAFAKAHGYPVRFAGKVITTEAIIKWGPFAYVKGNTLRYTLPVPPTEERGYVRPANADPKRVALLNDLVGHLGGDWATNAVDLGYAGMTNAQMATPFLTDARRAEVAAAWKKYLPLAFALPPYKTDAVKKPWIAATEPFTGQSYLWTYKIDGPGGYNYDLDWGNALPLYGLYKYATYSGDWAMVRAHWSDVKRVYRYFDVGDDWAWMTVVNADHGYSTGTGDPLCAAYAAHIACLKMARAVGDKAAERHFAVRAARVAVPTALRFAYTAFARKQGLLGPKDVALDYQEENGFTNSDLGGNPWYPTTLLSGDGVLPELFELYAAFVPADLRAYEADYARAYPDWFEGAHPYPFHTTYQGNSVYVTFPHLYARAALLHEPTPALLRFLDKAAPNRNNAWIGPNVVAELLARAPGEATPALILTDWLPAAYRDGALSAEGRQATLRFSLAAPSPWRLTVRPAPNRRIVRASVNGKTTALHTDKKGEVTVVVPRISGTLTVVLEMRERL